MDAEAIAGRYRREGRLGVGGMAEVWSAEDLELGRRVAIKLLGRGADRERFDREARAAASLSHPNICQLYDYGEVGDRPFMVLEYLPGGTLEDRISPGIPLDDEASARIACEIAAGLQHAHEQGLVHRDLKPANILFDTGGHAKIADFGIARLGDSGTITEAGTLLGTAAYLSPEQAAGEPATATSDVYSFGVILYRMLSGRLPFESESALDLVRRHRDESPPPLTELRQDAPPVLESLAMAALAKSPADRPADGAALVAELSENGAPSLPARGAEADRTQVLPFAARRPGSRRPRPRRRLLLAGVAASALLGGGIALAFVAADEGAVGPADATSPTRATSRETKTKPVTATAVSTGPQTTIASTAVANPPPATTEATTAPSTTTAPLTTESVTTTPPPPVTTTAETFAEPATTEPPVSTEVTTAPPPATTGPATTAAVTQELEAP